MTTRSSQRAMKRNNRSASCFPSLLTEQNTQSSELSPGPQRTRAKKYSKEESDALLMMCSEFHAIINKNSNSDADRKIKVKAWETIKRKFDSHCQAEGIYVENRTVEQLKSKYADLKKNARQVVSKMKRDVVETGNKKLQATTVRAMNDNITLLALRKQLGPSATGFQSQHCSDSGRSTLQSELNKLNASDEQTEKESDEGISNKIKSTTEHGETSHGQSSSTYTPRPVRKRKRTEFIGSVDSQTINLGSDDTSNDFDYDNDQENYEPSVRSGSQGVREINAMVESLDLPTFIDHVKELEAKRMANAGEEDRMIISGDEEAANETTYNPLLEDEEWNDPIQRQIRAQEAEDMENAVTRGRLTAPRNEIRIRQPKAKLSNNEQKIDELRSKQIKLVDIQTQLAEEQLHLQKILQENASIAQEEAQERLMHIKTQRQITEIELKHKQKELTQ